MYTAAFHQVFYHTPLTKEDAGDNPDFELFLTVHETKDCTKTPQEQAVLIANLLNGVWEV